MPETSENTFESPNRIDTLTLTELQALLDAAKRDEWPEDQIDREVLAQLAATPGGQ